MKSIFAPWRMEFILGKKERGCVFCKRGRRRRDREDLILRRGRWNFVIMNKFPYNCGHLMVVPYRHVASIEKMTADEGREMFDLVRESAGVLQRSIRPGGFNIGVNQGKAAGAGIDDHIHIHVIPRWIADTNFWPAISETKSMPEHLRTTYQRLIRGWKKERVKRGRVALK